MICKKQQMVDLYEFNISTGLRGIKLLKEKQRQTDRQRERERERERGREREKRRRINT